MKKITSPKLDLGTKEEETRTVLWVTPSTTASTETWRCWWRSCSRREGPRCRAFIHIHQASATNQHLEQIKGEREREKEHVNMEDNKNPRRRWVDQRPEYDGGQLLVAEPPPRPAAVLTISIRFSITNIQCRLGSVLHSLTNIFTIFTI